MKKEQILSTYDQTYAVEFDEVFNYSKWNENSITFQLNELGKLIAKSNSWLDVACGTGFILKHFNNIKKAGLDISPHMIEVARKENPGVNFILGNFLDEHPELEGQWDIVSCMWWAYCLVESIFDIRKLILNMSKWVSDDGVCFIPLFNPQKLDTKNIKLPYVDPNVPGKIMITGITWTWVQENGKRHDDLISPQIDHMVLMFKEFFNKVEIIEGPLDKIGEGWRTQDLLIAREKKNKTTIDEILNFPLEFLMTKQIEEVKTKPNKTLNLFQKIISKFRNIPNTSNQYK